MIDLTGEAQDINKMLYHADFEGGNVRVSENGIVTICVHGLCIVRDLKGWHELAARCGEIKAMRTPAEIGRDIKAALERHDGPNGRAVAWVASTTRGSLLHLSEIDGWKVEAVLFEPSPCATHETQEKT